MTRHRSPTALLPLLLVTATVVAGCGSAPSTADTPGQVLVQAAASLTDVFASIETRFERAHPDVDIVVNVAGSQTLATQIVQGVPADVFASADEQQVAVVRRAGMVRGQPRVFATNRLAIAVAAGNPLGLHDLADLARDDIVVVLADPAVPAGQFAQQALDRAAVTLAPASLEQDVRGVVSRIELGEADAGIVYVTDIISPAIRAVTIPPQHNVSASYPIALLAGSPNPDAAEMFVDYVLSADGQEILADFGFGPA